MKIWVEADIVRRRINALVALETTAIRSAIVSVLTGKGSFGRFMRKLSDGD